MKARHSIFTREISDSQRNMLQMKVCANELLPRIAGLSLFKNCTTAEVKMLLTKLDCRVKSFAAGEIVIHECDPSSSVVVVLSGLIQVFECGINDDSRHLVQRLYEDQTFGATFPATEIPHCPGMLQAEAPSEVLFISVSAIREMQQSLTTQFFWNLYAAASTQGFYAWRKLRLLSCYEIADRVLLYLKWRKEDGHLEPAHFRYGDLAMYLGVNRTALYRAIANLRKQRKISVNGDKISLT